MREFSFSNFEGFHSLNPQMDIQPKLHGDPYPNFWISFFNAAPSLWYSVLQIQAVLASLHSDPISLFIRFCRFCFYFPSFIHFPRYRKPQRWQGTSKLLHFLQVQLFLFPVVYCLKIAGSSSLSFQFILFYHGKERLFNQLIHLGLGADFLINYVKSRMIKIVISFY